MGLVLLLAAAVQADTFHLKGGDKLEGEVVEDLGEAYRIRTIVGVVDIEKERIVKRVEGPPPWRVYEEKRRKCANTAAAHYKLALWCRKHGLRAEENEQLERVIKLDPNHAEARDALGYVKKDGAWVQPPRPRTVRPVDDADRAAREEERLVRKLIAKWFVKVKAIYTGRMAKEKAGMESAKFRAARAVILKIRDPLAVPAVAGVLSTGHMEARKVMVESLAQFDSDEATMNLVVVALLDPSAEVRELAARELARRNDDRVVEHLREALGSEEEDVLRNAAVALGVLKARSAVEDLIHVLTTERVGRVRISRPVFLDGVLVVFGEGARYQQGGRMVYYRPIGIGVIGPGTMVGTATRYETDTITVHRTEVQEALITITGRNFGFDAEVWLAWWRKQKP